MLATNRWQHGPIKAGAAEGPSIALEEMVDSQDNTPPEHTSKPAGLFGTNLKPEHLDKAGHSIRYVGTGIP